MKISQRVFELLRGHAIMTDGETDVQGDYYRAPPTSSGRPNDILGIKMIAYIDPT